MTSWRIALEGQQHRAICGGCGWQCPATGCCGNTALRHAHELHISCAGGLRLAERHLAVAS